jgi:hypothetical protein
VCTRMGDAIVLDLVVGAGPSRDAAKLLRKSDLLAEELGMTIRITVARVAPPVALPVEPAVGGAVIALRSADRSG